MIYTISRLVIVLGLAISLSGAGPAVAPSDAPTADEITPEIEDAINGGLSFLASQQQTDGAIWMRDDQYRAAITGLSLLAFLAAGHTPGDGRYGLVVQQAEDYLVKIAPDDGYFGKIDGSRMYGQGIVTLALAEVYGVEHDSARRAKLYKVVEKAVGVIVAAQDVPKPPQFAGGWRYEPSSSDSDLSLSGWCALGLRAGQSVGIRTAKDRIARAVKFTVNCYRADQKGFAYQPGNDPDLPMTGVGVLDLHLMGAADRPELAPAEKYLVDHPITDATPYLFYSTYYTTQAAYQAGSETWQAVWKVNSTRLLQLWKVQQSATAKPGKPGDGGWPASANGQEPGRAFSTAMSVLSLTVPLRLLPAYQR